MNRRDRRAAQKQQQNTKVAGAPQAPLGAAPAGSTLPGQHATPRQPSWFMRAIASVLLSDWVLKRVQHPDVERLLISFARETGRQDVVEQLVQRHLRREPA